MILMDLKNLRYEKVIRVVKGIYVRYGWSPSKNAYPSAYWSCYAPGNDSCMRARQKTKK